LYTFNKISVKTKDILTSVNRDIIVRGEWLTDLHMEHFQNLLQNCFEYVETWRIQLPNTIQPVPKDKTRIQILHNSSGSN